MSQEWTTEKEDMVYARSLFNRYSRMQSSGNFDLFDFHVDIQAKSIGFCLSKWVLDLAHHYFTQYGPDQGEFVVRQVIGKYMTEGNTLH